MRTPKHRHFQERDAGYETPCWEWQGGLDNGGYGRCRDGDKLVPAHRWFYRLYRGEIPEDKVLDHLCRNRICVNPSHLEIVTQPENNRRGPHAKLTMGQARAIRASSAPTRDLARLYGVSERNIQFIRQGVRWIEDEPEKTEARAVSQSSRMFGEGA